MSVLRAMGIAALLVGFSLSLRAEDAAGQKPQTGSFQLTFTKRSELSTNIELVKRMGWVLAAEAAAKVDYTLPDESFEVYVPADYTGEKPFGLFVFCSPSPSGRPMGPFLKSMDERHLIWIGPNKAGNDRVNRPRMGLAIDAAISMKAKYNIDPDRVYVAGVSGGGRIASMLGVGYADIFKGGFYMIGCNFYRQELSVEQHGAAFPKSYSVPPAIIFNLARKQSKHVFLTGDKDMNREQTEVYYNAFKKDGFEHCTYLQVPGMGHRPPDEEWFEKGMAALDEKVEMIGAKGAAKKPATRAAAGSTQPAGTQSVPEHLLATARLYIDNKQYEIGRQKLGYIVEHYPGTVAAAEAKKLLAELAQK
jgi:hypothetical protein